MHLWPCTVKHGKQQHEPNIALCSHAKALSSHTQVGMTAESHHASGNMHKHYIQQCRCCSYTGQLVSSCTLIVQCALHSMFCAASSQWHVGSDMHLAACNSRNSPGHMDATCPSTPSTTSPLACMSSSVGWHARAAKTPFIATCDT